MPVTVKHLGHRFAESCGWELIGVEERDLVEMRPVGLQTVVVAF